MVRNWFNQGLKLHNIIAVLSSVRERHKVIAYIFNRQIHHITSITSASKVRFLALQSPESIFVSCWWYCFLSENVTSWNQPFNFIFTFSNSGTAIVAAKIPKEVKLQSFGSETTMLFQVKALWRKLALIVRFKSQRSDSSAHSSRLTHNVSFSKDFEQKVDNL